MADRMVTIPVHDALVDRLMAGELTAIDMEALLWQLRSAIEREGG